MKIGGMTSRKNDNTLRRKAKAHIIKSAKIAKSDLD